MPIFLFCFLAGNQQTMVEGELFCFRADSLWNVGWSIHVMHDQHIWGSHLPEDGMDGGEFRLDQLCFES